VLAIPMLREDELIGGLTVNQKTPGSFAPEVIELLQTFVTQSVIAMQCPMKSTWRLRTSSVSATRRDNLACGSDPGSRPQTEVSMRLIGLAVILTALAAEKAQTDKEG
jgi:hypothetical protein